MDTNQLKSVEMRIVSLSAVEKKHTSSSSIPDAIVQSASLCNKQKIKKLLFREFRRGASSKENTRGKTNKFHSAEDVCSVNPDTLGKKKIAVTAPEGPKRPAKLLKSKTNA